MVVWHMFFAKIHGLVIRVPFLIAINQVPNVHTEQDL